jgi:hypothetical protein
MKIADIKADGTVYWFERGNSEWGTSLSESYHQGAVVRHDEERYSESGSYRRTVGKDPKGRMIAVRFVSESKADPDTVRYVQATQVRGTYEEAKARVAAHQAKHEETKARIERMQVEVDAEAVELKARLAALGLNGFFRVTATKGSSYWREPRDPKVRVEFAGHDEDANLRAIIERVETIKEQGRHGVHCPAHYGSGECTKTNDCRL